MPGDCRGWFAGPHKVHGHWSAWWEGSPGRCDPGLPEYSRDSVDPRKVEDTRRSPRGCVRAGNVQSRDGAVPWRSTAAHRERLFWLDDESVESGRDQLACPRV